MCPTFVNDSTQTPINNKLNLSDSNLIFRPELFKTSTTCMPLPTLLNKGSMNADSSNFSIQLRQGGSDECDEEEEFEMQSQERKDMIKVYRSHLIPPKQTGSFKSNVTQDSKLI